MTSGLRANFGWGRNFVETLWNGRGGACHGFGHRGTRGSMDFAIRAASNLLPLPRARYFRGDFPLDAAAILGSSAISQGIECAPTNRIAGGRQFKPAR